MSEIISKDIGPLHVGAGFSDGKFKFGGEVSLDVLIDKLCDEGDAAIGGVGGIDKPVWDLVRAALKAGAHNVVL